MHVVIKLTSFTSEYTYIVEWKLMIICHFVYIVSGKTHLGLLGMRGVTIACVIFIGVSHHLKVEVHMDEVEYLQSLRFTWTKIAQIVGISHRTLCRRLSEWNLPLDTYYSTISDSDLDSLVAQVKSENHTCG